MNSTSDSTAPRSPRRCLLAAAQKGRQRWKQKAQLRNQQLKVLKVRVRDLQRSRHRHAQKAQQAQTELQKTQQQLQIAQRTIEELQTQLQQPQKKISPQTSNPLPQADSTA